MTCEMLIHGWYQPRLDSQFWPTPSAQDLSWKASADPETNCYALATAVSNIHNDGAVPCVNP